MPLYLLTVPIFTEDALELEDIDIDIPVSPDFEVRMDEATLTEERE